MRENLILECTECKHRNYMTSRETRQGEKLALRKHCPKCRKHTVHKEKKK